MRFLAKMKEKQMQKRLGGALFGLLCAGMLVMPSAWAAGGLHDFYGTDGKTKQLTGAKVSLDTGSYRGIYGGYNDDKPGQRVYKNQITLTGNTYADYAFGGYSVNGDVAENTVSITNMDKFGTAIYGGCSINGAASKNTVSITDIVKFDGEVYGGYCGYSGYGDAAENTVSITNMDNFCGDVFGGCSIKGDAAKNTVSITNIANLGGAIFGGYSENGDAAENTVSISGSTVNKDVFGGYADKESVNNTVNIKDSTIIGRVYGGCSDNCDAAENTVSISGSTVNNNVFGGAAYKESVNNIVNIKDSTIIGRVYGGWAINGLSENNTVNIKDSTIEGSIYGGYAYDGSSNYNTVILNHSEIMKNVYGGYAVNYRDVTTITIDNNTVALQNGTIVNGIVYGGFDSKGKVTPNNNTLEIAGVGNKAGNVKNFDNFNFVVDNTVSYGDTMLTITGRDTSAAANNLTVNNDKLNVKVVNPEKLIAAEATPANKIITLIDNKAGVINGFTGTKDVSVTAGALLTYDGEVSLIEEKKLTLKIGNFKAFTPEAKSLVETRAAAGFVVNNMADFMQSTGMEQARAAAFEGDKELAPFAAIGGSKMRYETGSYVDVNGWNGALGIAKKAGDMTYGIALEHGKGSYDSYLDSGVHADGDIKSTGGVIFGELKQDNGVHFEAALRAGRVKSDYQSATTSYDESSTYYGFSLGGGKEITMNDKAALDLYGRFYYTHTNSSDTTASSGEKLAFDAVNSQRIRLGGRYTVDMNDNGQAYAGLAWQYEFGGDAKAAINGYAAPTPSLKGHSGIVEAGYKLNAGKNLVLDFNLNGAFGKQRGFGGALAAQWQF